MRTGGVAGVADAAEDIAAMHALSFLHADASRLQMRVRRVQPAVETEHDAVAGRGVDADRDGGIHRAGSVLRNRTPYVDCSVSRAQGPSIQVNADERSTSWKQEIREWSADLSELG